MARFRVPASPVRQVISIEEFRGVDLYNAPSNVHKSRSPEAPNMIRDEVGKVRKRMGYETIHAFQGQRINGVHRYKTDRLVHAGNALYRNAEETPIYSGMNDTRSLGWRMGQKLYLQDGMRMLVYDGETVRPVDEDAYVPTIIISRGPQGGGTTLEPLNLLGRKWTEQFLGEEGTTSYSLTADLLDADPVIVKTLVSSGSWVERSEGVDFTVNRLTGVVTFTSAPGISPVTGADNISITAAKTREGYAERINHCNVGVLYGVNGAPDRLFVAGNVRHQGTDHYSQIQDPTYFGDIWYLSAGQEDSDIVGYSVAGTLLAVHLRQNGDGRNILLRSGIMVETPSGETAAFPIVSALQGEEASARHGFAYLNGEPLYLTQMGVYGLAERELGGDRFAQLRSLFIRPALQTEPDPGEMVVFAWRDLCLISGGTGTVYVMDGLQKAYDANAPSSSFQYECYVWNGPEARVFWEEDGLLCFGTPDGRLCRFFDSQDDPEAYNDDGAPIRAYWDTPDLDGKLFYQSKTFRYVSVRLASAMLTGLKIYVQKRGLWSLLFDAGEKARFFDWSYVDFSKVVFSADRTPKTVGGKILIKKVDKAKFRLLNETLNEPFGLYSFALEFTQSGKYHG